MEVLLWTHILIHFDWSNHLYISFDETALSETETEIDSVVHVVLRVLVLESGVTGIGVNCFKISTNSVSLCLSPAPMLSRAKIASNSAEALAKVAALSVLAMLFDERLGFQILLDGWLVA